jgi:phage gpG-like protein
MIEVTTDTSGFASDLTELQKRLGNLRPVLAQIGAVLETQVQERRETLTDPDGDAWEPWAASTLATYPKDGRRKLLDRTGAMWDRTGPQWQIKGMLSDLVLRVAFDKGYSTYHEFGTERMPRRGLLYGDPNTGRLGQDDEDAINDVLERWLRKTGGV